MRSVARTVLLGFTLWVAMPLHAGEPAVDEAQALMNAGQLDQALAGIEAYLVERPDSAEALYTQGLILSKLNRAAEAQLIFEALVRDYPQLPEPYNNLAVIYAQQGDFTAARDTLENVLAAFPDYGTAHENLGDVYAALASSSYDRALKFDDDSPMLKYKFDMVSKFDDPMPSPQTDEQVAAASPALAPPPPKGRAISAPAKTPAATSAGSPEKAVKDWVKAWESRDLDVYLAAYAPDFKPEGGIARADWVEKRRFRLGEANKIEVKISGLKIERLGAGQARARFQQKYTSNVTQAKTEKVLELSEQNGRWLITREYAP